MAAVRDPAFWKRFSIAVHLDEAATTQSQSPTTSLSSRPDLKASESWLDRQTKKRKRNRCMLCGIALLLAAGIAVVALLCVWLARHGWFLHGEAATFP
ncbi:hypothetical protein MMC12_000467 [Toensbergia leucococca]|nr:hypothetical protein [Toensbergia leucococca]